MKIESYEAMLLFEKISEEEGPIKKEDMTYFRKLSDSFERAEAYAFWSTLYTPNLNLKKARLLMVLSPGFLAYGDPLAKEARILTKCEGLDAMSFCKRRVAIQRIYENRAI